MHALHASLVPTANDLAGLIAYVLGNPYLFISSSTVMTTGLVIAAAAISVIPRTAPALRTVAPPLAMVLVYFGLGSMALATEILIRFHAQIPDATETQFASGVGHLLEAAAGVAILIPHLRHRTRRTWIVGNAIAVTYWTAQVVVLTPPWLAFGGQLELMRGLAFGSLGVGACLSLALWRTAPAR
jgi:hypothetical protein